MSQSDVKIIKANKNLKEKVGTGDIAATRVEASQNMIENNEVDFEPMAAEFLDALADGVKTVRERQEMSGQRLCRVWLSL